MRKPLYVHRLRQQYPVVCATAAGLPVIGVETTNTYPKSVTEVIGSRSVIVDGFCDSMMRGQDANWYAKVSMHEKGFGLRKDAIKKR